MTDKLQTVGLLLAAGRGSRFDPNSPGRKLRQQLSGRSIALHSLLALSQTVDTVIIAVRDLNDEFALDAGKLGATIVQPPDADLGMGHSLAHLARIAFANHPLAVTWIVALADMPWIQVDTLRALQAESQRTDCIVQPRYGGVPGNPVVFPARFAAELMRCVGDVGARTVLRTHPEQCRALDVDDGGVLRDVDVPADIAANPT